MRKALTCILFSILILQTNGQSISISGTVNTYYKAEEVFSSYIQMDAGADLSTLQAGDKIVLIQMVGVDINPTFQSYSDFNNAGRYEMLAVKSVNNGTKRIEPTVTLDPAMYDPGEKIQVVKIFEADYATVTGTLTAKDWDGETGGIIALVIFKKLTLNANISADYNGFRGAEPVPNYSYGCSIEETYYYPDGTTNRAGQQGESFTITTWTNTVGPGINLTGGGGGIGYFAGGGGGSHWGTGGSGGIQRQSCTGIPFVFAGGGVKIDTSSYFYGYEHRVTMGGGGGSSTEDASYAATRGGDGGGIVIILADTVENGGSYSIQSRGEPVNTTAQAGGGGGGAGGAILLDVNVYVNALTLDVSGGKGGNTGTQYTGAGGGGGGGIISYADTLKPALLNPVLTRGMGGLPSNSNSDLEGGDGTNGGHFGSLELPLNGFLFNSLTGTDTLCQGQVPNTIRGSMPKGGESGYIYQWIQSTDGISWAIIPATDSLEYSPPALFQTTWYNRIVTSGPVVDTAIPVKIYVWDSIAGNNLAIRDSICENSSPGLLTGGAITNGGNGIYGYLWQSSTNQLSWTDRAPLTASLNEGDLTLTTYYRRIVTSAKVCADTSNIDTISVLNLINNNGFTNLNPDTAICEGLPGGTIQGLQPTGGDGYFLYSWLVSDDDITYTVIGGAYTQDYITGILSTDKYYKRVVYSGADNACIDTTIAYPVTVYPAIGSNIISTDSSRYCAGDIPAIISGAIPTGGDDPNYIYTWWKRELEGDWEQITGVTGASYTPSAAYKDTVLVKRRVVSGNYSACLDESDSLRIDVIPYIDNSLVSGDETVCEESLPVAFSEADAQGGTGVFEYLWQVTPEGAGDWQPASEDVTANNLVSYASPELNTSSQYRRRVTSEICTSYSDTITITVYELIGNNTITGGIIQYTCFNSPKALSANAPSGGNNVDYNFFWEESIDEAAWSNAAGTTSGQNFTSPPLTDSIFYRRIVHSGELAQCKDTSDAVLVRINPLPTGDIISSSDTVCANGDLTILYQGLTGNSPWEIKVGESDTLNASPGLADASGEITFSVSESANIRILDLIDANGCHSDLTGNTGLVELTVWEYPNVSAGEDDEVCGPEYTLAANNDVGAGVWSGAEGQFSAEDDPTTTVIIQNYGEHTFTWTVTNWQCETSAEVKIIFYELPDQPYAGEDFHLDNKYQATLNADPASLGTGTWKFESGSGSFSDSAQHNTLAYFNGPGEYTLSWSVKNGVCDAVSDEISLSINDLELFTGFSPNGDGINDEFILILTGEVDAELIIFDQWGGIVYRESKPSAEEFRWNGELNNGGNSVPEGTYYYVLKQAGRSDVKKYVELRR